jgi:anti-sigma regulatory factor (Ser/Thr protein kinase)
MCQHASPSATSAAPAGATVERSFPGHYSHLSHARTLIARFAHGYPAADDVILLVSELCANAVTHSASGQPGGTFTIRARRCGTTCVYAEVEDQGSTWNGNLTTARSPHGLYLLQQLSTHSGTRPGPHGWITWLTITRTTPQQPAQQ